MIGALINPMGRIVELTGGRKVVTTAGVRVQISTSETQISGVIIQALPTNTGNIALGGSDVSAQTGTENGIQLVPGQTETIATPDLQHFWIDSVVNGEGICYSILKG